MVDNVLFYSKVHEPEVFRKECFKPFKTGFNLHLFSHYPPLFVKQTPNGVVVANSLQKAFSGNNTGNFTRSEIEWACLALSEIFGVEPEAFKVLRLELKANIRTPEAAQSYLHAYKSHKVKPFYFAPPPRGFGKPLLVAAHSTNRILKLYDAGTYNGLKEHNLLSVELVLKNQRAVKAAAKEQVNMGNLYTFEVLNNLKQTALTMLNECTYMPEVLPAAAVGCLGKHWNNKLKLLYAPPNYWATLKAINPNTYKETRKEFNEVKRIIAPYLPPPISGLVEQSFTEALSA